MAEFYKTASGILLPADLGGVMRGDACCCDSGTVSNTCAASYACGSSPTGLRAAQVQVDITSASGTFCGGSDNCTAWEGTYILDLYAPSSYSTHCTWRLNGALTASCGTFDLLFIISYCATLGRTGYNAYVWVVGSPNPIVNYHDAFNDMAAIDCTSFDINVNNKCGTCSPYCSATGTPTCTLSCRCRSLPL